MVDFIITSDLTLIKYQIIKWEEYTHTHTHTHIYIYIYILPNESLGLPWFVSLNS